MASLNRKFFMKEIQTHLWIQAPAPEVWKAFHDPFLWKGYRAFKPVSDPAYAVGNRFKLNVHFPWTFPVTVPVEILEYRPLKEVRWVGRFPGFRGEHYFLFQAGNGNTLVTHGEKFSGILGHLFAALLAQDHPRILRGVQ